MIRSIVIAVLCAVVRFSPAGRRRTFKRLPRRVKAWLTSTTTKGPIVVPFPGGPVTIPDPSLTSIFSTYYWEGPLGYEPQTSRFVLENAYRYSWFADIGAYLGHYALLFASANPAGSVRAFEPTPKTADALREIVALNQLRIEVLEAAIGEKSGKGTLYVPTASADALPSSSSLLGSFISLKKPETTTVKILSLDEALEGMSGLGLIKIDAEGSEAEIIAAGATELSKRRPDLILEVVVPAQCDYREIDAVFGRIGYRTRLLNKQSWTSLSAIRLEDLPYRKMEKPEGWGEVLATPS